MSTHVPLLSICIPTLNRGELLKVLLENLEQQAFPYLDKIEIVVADNASSDITADVVGQSSLPIIYGRQESTVGFARNVLFATTQLASGKFVWVIGDDDLILPNGLSRVIDSLLKFPELNYHYLNFGWIDVEQRKNIVQKNQGKPDDSYLQRLQCNEKQSLRLDKIEDLATLPSDNISALFSGIFCFVTLRSYFVEGQSLLNPSDSLDGSSTLIADCFPHAMISIPNLIGKPIAYIGEPCLMQGINGWEWGSYAYKNMIFGTFQFFEWLEKTTFCNDSMKLLWQSYFNMAGKLLFRMFYLPDEHKGLDIVLEEAIPFSAKNTVFWESFMNESRMYLSTEFDADKLRALLLPILKHKPTARVGLWGIAGRGHRFVKDTPEIHSNLVWVADQNSINHGINFDGTELIISAPETIIDANLDILVIGTRPEFIGDVITSVSNIISSEIMFISTDGIKTIN